MYSLNVLGSRQNEFTIFEVHYLYCNQVFLIHTDGLTNLFADVGTNTEDIKTNAGEIDANYKSINKAEILNLDHCKTTSK